MFIVWFRALHGQPKNLEPYFRVPCLFNGTGGLVMCVKRDVTEIIINRGVGKEPAEYANNLCSCEHSRRALQERLKARWPAGHLHKYMLVHAIALVWRRPGIHKSAATPLIDQRNVRLMCPGNS